MSLRDERIGVFIDGASLQQAAKLVNLVIDYKRILMLFRQHGRVIRATYYATVVREQNVCTVRPLLDWLSYNGFTVVAKAMRSNVEHAGNLRVEIAVDAMQLADSLDHLILFTGDRELCPLVAAVQQRGKRVSVISTLRGEPAVLADELRRQADQFLELESLRQILCREDRMVP